MIAERTDMLDQWRGRTGHAFVYSPAKPLNSNRMTRDLLRLAESPFPAVAHTAVSRAFLPCIRGLSCGAVDLVDGVFAHASGCEIITEGAVR
jgi:hypothetical protein